MIIKRKLNKGFTLIELLVVVSIISLLASVVMSSLASARDKAQDARRKSDLKQIQAALELYYNKCGSYIVRPTCTDATAYGATGNGWFNYAYGAPSAGSVAQGLVDTGVAGGVIIDPSGLTQSNAVDRTGYMIWVSGTKYTIWANLKYPSTADIATMNICALSNYDNYQAAYAPQARINYCVSN